MVSSYLVVLSVVVVSAFGNLIPPHHGPDGVAMPLPVVMWHGMGDTCCNPLSMGRLQKTIQKQLGNMSYVLSLKIGNTVNEDQINGFLMDTDKQIEMVCKMLADDPKIKAAGKYNAVGFSQGGQFLRAVAQRCPVPQMNNLVSVGGQHQGVYGFPKCPGSSIKLCDYMRKLLNMGAYVPFVQNTLVQAQYWHDPINEAEYKEKSKFIADINQERTVNATYKQNFMKLNNLVLVKFNKDTMVQPPDSEWFGFYNAGQAKTVYNMTASKLYMEDTIGLKHLDQMKKVHFLSLESDHLQFSDQWFIDQIITPYFK